MEKLVRPYDKEYMRMAMLKHEETFKAQVYELHRLYGIQKMLMENMEASRGIEVSQQGWNLKNAFSSTQNHLHKGAEEKTKKMIFDLERPALGDIAESESDGFLEEIMDETEIELTLGPSSCNRKKIETPLTSDSGHGLLSSSGSSFMDNKGCRINHSSYTSREELSGGIIGLAQVPHSISGCQRVIRNSYDIEEKSRQETSKQTPWLFQVLSLNMT